MSFKRKTSLSIPNRNERLDGSPAMGFQPKQRNAPRPSVYKCNTCGRDCLGAAAFCRGCLNAVALRP